MDKKIAPKWFGLKKYRTPIIVGLLAFLTIIIALTLHDSSVISVSKKNITLATVVEGDFEDYLNVRGRVEPLDMAYLDAVEGGIIERIVAEEGALVSKGDTLLILSNLNLSLNILNSEAQLAEKANFLRETQISMEQQKLVLEKDLLQLKYELNITKRLHEHNEGYFQKELISKDEYLTSKEKYALAKSLTELSEKRIKQDAIFRTTQIRKIKQNLESMERNMELIYQRQNHLVVQASFDGQLASVNAVLGQSIIPGHRFGQLNVLGNYKLEANIDEHYIDRIQEGLNASFTRNKAVFALRLNKVYPEVMEGQFSVDLIFEDASPEQMRSGQTYNVHVELSDPTVAILIPKGSFFQETGGRWIYVLNEAGTEAIKKNIRIGRQNPKYYEVLEGLNKGDQVITSDYAMYNEAQKLKLN